MADEETPVKRGQRACRTLGVVLKKSACAMCGCACLGCMCLVICFSISFALSNWILRQAHLQGIKPSGHHFVKMMEGKNHSEVMEYLNSSEFATARERAALNGSISSAAEAALQARRERLKQAATPQVEAATMASS